MKTLKEFIKLRDELVNQLLAKYENDPKFKEAVDALKKNKKRKDEKKE